MKSPNSCDSCLCLLLHWILHHGNDDSASHKWRALARSIGIQLEAPCMMPNASLSCHVPSAGRSGALRRCITMSMGPENLANTTPPRVRTPERPGTGGPGGVTLQANLLGHIRKNASRAKGAEGGTLSLDHIPNPAPVLNGHGTRGSVSCQRRRADSSTLSGHRNL